jgi:predicted enzyme related to lactoylglutathione lyase
MSFYIDVDDLATYRRKIEQAGGKILVPEQEVPGMGSFALFSDPDGRVLGIWKQTAAR